MKRDSDELIGLHFLFCFKLFLLCRSFWKLNRSPEEEDVRLRFMNQVMDPSMRLLNAKSAPLTFRHQVCLGNQFRDLFGQNDVSEQ